MSTFLGKYNGNVVNIEKGIAIINSNQYGGGLAGGTAVCGNQIGGGFLFAGQYAPR